LAAPMQGGGRGNVLLCWLQEAARSQGAGGIDLHVAFDNPRAEALYRRLGFGDASDDSATHRRLLWAIS
jgi:ribosomal protein S18 acetylase RimI-like enzyme